MVMQYFNEISVRATKKWVDDNGKKHQQTKKFYQTINPWNLNKDGLPKSRFEIEKEIREERDKWMRR
jgi:predicted HNH restriction endonuclease